MSKGYDRSAHNEPDKSHYSKVYLSRINIAKPRDKKR